MSRIQLAEFRSTAGCVVSYCPVASSIASQVLHRGGNAVDAAVANALALAVTYPQAGNLGGGGFMLIDLGTGTHFLDFRETVPKRIDAGAYLDSAGRNEKSVLGGAAVCVPGTVAGLGLAVERFGTWAWDDIVALVIDLAETGYWMTTRQSAYVRMYEDDLRRFDTTRKTFLVNDAAPLPGTIWRQPDLGVTLRYLAEHGPAGFYRGEIAERMIETIRAEGGVMEEDDLRGYEARWRKPLSGSFYGRTLYTAAPPSGGGLVILLSAAILQAADVARVDPRDPARYQLLARAFRIAFEARRRLTSDPDNASPAELQQNNETLSYFLSLAGNLDKLEHELGLDIPAVGPKPQDEHKNTTHLCVLDANGGAVSLTYSLNTLFGSKVVPRGCGFLLNNSVDDFSIGNKPNYYGLIDSAQNQLEPGRRATGSMAPSLVVNDGKIELIIGGSGGPRIPTLITQVLVQVLCDGELLPVAMRSPRVHQQHSDYELWVEPTFTELIQRGLEDAGFSLRKQARLGIGAGIQKVEGNVYASLDYRFSQ